MKKVTYLLLAVLVALMLPVTAMAAENDIAAMIDALPTVEEFKAMDNAQQVDAYNRTQEAYDAYMALPTEEKEALAGAEEVFDALFSHYNTLIAPAEPAENTGKIGYNYPVWIILGGLVLLLAGLGLRKKAK